MNAGNLTGILAKASIFFSSEIVRMTLLAVCVFVAGMLVIWVVSAQVRRMAERNIISAVAAERIRKATIALVLIIILIAELYIATSNTILLIIVFVVIVSGVAASIKILSMIISHYALVLSRHVAQGEYIEVMGVRGRIKSIGLIHTTIRCDDGSQLMIPNNKLLEEPVRHVGTERSVSIRIKLAISNPNDLSEIEERLEAIVRERFKHTPRAGEYSVRVEALEGDSVTYVLKTKYLGTEVREEVISSLVKELYQGLNEYDPKIEIAELD